jgi:peroxiredoxin
LPVHRRTALWIPLLAAAALAWAVPLSAAGDELSDVLNRHRVRPVMPPSPAVDFTLKDISDAEVSLRDHQGRWVLLTFWATWCGPCISEMPSLQRFWEDNADQGFSVLAVAVGSDAAAVQGLVSRQGLTFPVLLDVGDRVAARYQAWSVPLTYLVDPAGRLVGVVQGARDWAATRSLVADLNALGLASDEGPPPAASPARIELPLDLIPPTATVELATERPVLGEPLSLLVKVSWAGTGEDYRIHPPHLGLPDGLRQEAIAASSSSADGRRVLTYTVSLLPEQAGTFDLGPVEIRFTPEGGTEPLATRVAGPSIPVREGSSGVLLPGLVAVVVLGAILVSAVVWRSKRRKGVT